jgi:hypothetical protein
MAGFRSQAQRKKWGELVSEGKVTQEQYNAREMDTPPDVPERTTPRVRTVGASRSTDAAQVGKTRY